MNIEDIVHQWIHGGAWDRECIENTANLGLAEADQETLEAAYGDDAEQIGVAIVAECRHIVAQDQ